MTVNDINVDAKFQLRALRDDYVHAFVTYFIAEFTACSQKTAISTGTIALELARRSLSISLASSWRWLYALETNGVLLS